MTDINVNTNNIISYSMEIHQTAVRLSRLGKEIEAVKKAGFFNSAYNTMINASIMNLSESVLTKAAKMDSMGSALETIANYYRRAEKAILSGKSGIIISIADIFPVLPGTDKRNLWEKIVDWFRHKDPDMYDTTTRAQEKAADAMMKKELWKILQDEKYSPEHWDKASIEERKQILQDYMNEVIKVYGLKDVNVNINWDPDAKYTSKSITWGYYTHGTHTVTLNEAALADSVGNWDSYDLLETVSHELRHAYQHEAIDHPTQFMVSKETIDTWKNNFDNYINSDTDYDAYRAQPVEVDARDFQVNRNSRVSSGPQVSRVFPSGGFGRLA